jgi:hypothetical protein
VTSLLVVWSSFGLSTENWWDRPICINTTTSNSPEHDKLIINLERNEQRVFTTKTVISE